MTEKKQRFVIEFLKDVNATQAAIRSGHPKKSAYQRGYELLQEKCVQEAIQKAMAARSKRVELVADDVLQELKALVFFDPRKLFNSDGSPIPIHELDRNTARAIAGLEVLEEYEGTGENRKFVGYLRKYKLVDKNAAIDKAMRHLALYNDKMKHDHKHTHTLEELIAGSNGEGDDE